MYAGGALFAVRCLAAVLALLVPALSLSAENAEVYKVRLAPVAISIPMRVNVAGSGLVTASLTGNKLTISGKFEGLPSNATAAQIHQGTAIGVRGRTLLDLSVSKATSGNVSGSYDLTSEQLEALKRGRWYVQIDSEKAPEGTLWGWIVK